MYSSCIRSFNGEKVEREGKERNERNGLLDLLDSNNTLVLFQKTSLHDHRKHISLTVINLLTSGVLSCYFPQIKKINERNMCTPNRKSYKILTIATGNRAKFGYFFPRCRIH